jgi:hypothetical protein
MSDTNKDSNSGENRFDLLIGIILFLVIVIVWYFSWQYIDSNVYSSNNMVVSDEQERGVFGDKFGAINSLFSGLAFAGIIFTIFLQKRELRLQREELTETRNEFIQQNQTLKKQRFENTFFQLVQLHNDIVDKLKIKAVDQTLYEKREFFIGAIKELKYRSKYEYYKFSALNKLSPPEITSFKAHRENHHDFFDRLDTEERENLLLLNNQQIENFISEPLESKEENIRKDYEIFFHNYQYNLGHYFRNLYHMFKYIHINQLIEKEEKQFYSNVVRAQLSTDELVLIFYNSLTPIKYYSDHPNLGYPNFKYLIDKYDILQNMNERLLLDTAHMKIFRKNVVAIEPETFKKLMA